MKVASVIKEIKTTCNMSQVLHNFLKFYNNDMLLVALVDKYERDVNSGGSQKKRVVYSKRRISQKSEWLI